MFRHLAQFILGKKDKERVEVENEAGKELKPKKKHPTAKDVRRKQGPGMWQGDIGE